MSFLTTRGRVAVLRPGRLARADELRHLVELREVVRLAARGHLDAWQVEGEIADGNKPAACLLFVFAHRSPLHRVDAIHSVSLPRS